MIDPFSDGMEKDPVMPIETLVDPSTYAANQIQAEYGEMHERMVPHLIRIFEDLAAIDEVIADEAELEVATGVSPNRRQLMEDCKEFAETVDLDEKIGVLIGRVLIIVQNRLVKTLEIDKEGDNKYAAEHPEFSQKTNVA